MCRNKDQFRSTNLELLFLYRFSHDEHICILEYSIPICTYSEIDLSYEYCVKELEYWLHGRTKVAPFAHWTMTCCPTIEFLFCPDGCYLDADYATVYFTFWNLISNHLESNRRLVADCLAWRDLHNLLNHPAFKRNSYIFTTIRGQFHEYMLEFLLKWGWYNWLCKSAPTTSRRPVADQLRTTLPLFLHHLHFSGSNRIFILYGSLVWLSMVVDAASKTSGRPKLLGDHQQPFADHRKPPGKRVVVGGRREVVDVILWQPVTDHRQTFADLRQPPATTPKIVVVRGRRLVVAIVWPSLYMLKGSGSSWGL